MEGILTIFKIGKPRKLTITLSNFVKFQQILLDGQVNCITNQFCNFTPLSQIVHLFFYYILSLSQIPELDSVLKKLPSNYQESCRKQFLKHYLAENMEIKIFQYSLLCSRLLNQKTDICIHYIYFFVYGKVASVPYVSLLCQGKKYKKKSKRNSKVLTNFYRHSMERKKTLMLYTSSQELRYFAKQLHQALKTENDAVKQQKRQQEIHQRQQEQQLQKQQDYVLVPPRIQNNEKSAIVRVFTPRFCNQNYHIRKKRFNNVCFNYENNKKCEFYERDIQNPDQNKKNSLKNSNRDASVDFSRINQKIKAQNDTLDKIRFQAIKTDRMFQKIKRSLFPQKFFHLENRQDKPKIKDEEEYLKKQKEIESMQNEILTQSEEDEKENLPHKEQIENLLRKSQSTEGQNTEKNRMEDLEKNNHIFTKAKGIASRTQKFKKQLKAFTKNQLFDGMIIDDQLP